MKVLGEQWSLTDQPPLDVLSVVHEFANNEHEHVVEHHNEAL